MPVSVAYLAVVLIWSTTPLGIVWSSESVNPTLAVLMRMLIAVILGYFLLLITRTRLPWSAPARKLYTFSSIGIVGGMLFAYFAARYISSGMMSLIFGLAPIISGLLAQKILSDPKFSGRKKLALGVALLGLFIICFDSLALNENGYIGIAFVLMAVFFFSISGVLVKSVDIAIHPLATTVGSLSFSVPVFALIWLIFDGTLPIEQWQTRSIWAIVYLGVFGSLLGFLAYFFILQKLAASSVALITMMTPMFALYLGSVFNNESISIKLIVGALLVLVGLGLYQFSERIMKKRESRTQVN